MSNAQQSHESIFSHKGWNRLVVVLAAAYIVVIVCLVIRERSTINPFHQYDLRLPHVYTSWSWSASALRLQPRVDFIAEVMFFPPVALALAVYSVLWIHRGFRLSRQSSAGSPNA